MPNTSRTSRLRLRPTLMAAGAAVALLAAGCGDTTKPEGSAETAATVAPEGQPAAAGQVTIERSRYSPMTLTVEAGATVEFVNVDPFAHTVTAVDDSELDYTSGSMDEDGKFEQRFDKAGTYEYFCEIHPTMRGTITVR